MVFTASVVKFIMNQTIENVHCTWIFSAEQEILYMKCCVISQIFLSFLLVLHPAKAYHVFERAMMCLESIQSIFH